jgi:L-threonylcarbamoyladenylate synthase
LSSLQIATPENIAKGISLLKQGIPISFPTDTVYALSAPINDIRSVQKVFEMKRRPMSMALPILIGDADDIDIVSTEISNIAKLLMREFWPGALTLILKKTRFVPDIVVAGGPTVAVRMAYHSLASEIIKGVGIPLVGTSANVHGQPSPVTALEVFDQLGESLEMILDAGKTPGGVESTILDVSTSKPILVRQGAVSREQLERFCRVY